MSDQLGELNYDNWMCYFQVMECVSGTRLASALAMRRRELWDEAVIAECHRIDNSVEPRPLSTMVFVGPGRRAFVHHVATIEDERTVPFVTLQKTDRAGNAALHRSFRIKRQCVGVVVGKLQQRDCRCRVKWNDNDQQQENDDFDHAASVSLPGQRRAGSQSARAT